MNWQEILPKGATLVRQSQYSYNDPELPHEIPIVISETLAGSPQPAAVLAVVDVNRLSLLPGRARFVEQPRGWGTNAEEALFNCIRCIKMLLVANDK